MTNLLDRLGLKPHEKRVVVVVSAVVFLVLNYLFVWPRLGDYRTLLARTEEAEDKRELFDLNADKLTNLTNRVQQLERGGAGSLKHDQGSQFLSAIQTEASKAMLNIMQTRNLPPLSGHYSTNDFVEDRVIMINFNAADSNLVDFLYAFSLPKSSLRVQSFDIGPEAPAQQRLSGSLTLVGSIDRPPATKSAASKSKPKDNKSGTPAQKTEAAGTKSNPGKPAGPTTSDKNASKKPAILKPGGPTPPVKPALAKTNSISNKK